MKIVVAMDSFKGGLSAAAACRAVAAGLRAAAPGAELVLKPMADGGEGTAAALMAARPDGVWVPETVAGPRPERSVAAGYAWFVGDGTALVEMAAANGLPLLAESDRNPLETSTFGTGQLLRAAAGRGAKRIFLALGGSATVDGGVGAATALDWRFLAAAGRPVGPGGGRLREIVRIVPPDRPGLPPVTALCDVDSPLCGPLGAATVFGPQKGATPGMVARLDAGLAHLARLVQAQLGRDIAALPGGGAAGGLGAGAAAFFDAALTPGIAAIAGAARLPKALHGADWCLTGEGSFDSQSLAGKVVSGVAGAARAAGVPVVVLAGRVRGTPGALRALGIRAVLAIHDPGMPMGEVMRRETELLAAAAERWLKEARAGRREH